MVAVRRAVPESILIELHRIFRHGSRHHRAETSVTQRQFFLPCRSRSMIPKPVGTLQNRGRYRADIRGSKMKYYRLCIAVAGKIADYASGYREYIRGCQVQAIVRKREFVILDQRLYGQRLRSERISQYTCRTCGQLDFLIKPERYFPRRRNTRRI